ncbi:3-dehydroquinate dehydratase type I [Dillenia turbinata]|uniref:3-dehydroquinate dehydratase type I n=1 Tax=Dillenia turbinata TaxID=194707 RepID=A0AAN8UJ16_9MAGN
MSSSSLEKISSSIILAESGKENLGKAVDHLRSYSSEVLLVNVQWKDLQDLFDSTQASIQHQFDELKAKTVEFENRVKEFEDRERSIEQRFGSWEFREKGLGRLEEIKVMEEKIKERLKEVERKEELLNSWDRNVRLVEKRLEERLADFEVKEKKFESKRKLFDSTVRDAELRERRFEERLRDFEAKEMRFVVDASSIEKRLKVIAEKEKEVDALRVESEVQLKELELKGKDLKEREKKFGHTLMEKELKLDAIREKYEMGMEELQSKQREIKAREEKLSADVRSMEELLNCVKEKALKIDEIRRGYEKRVDELQSKEKEFEAKEQRLKCVHEKELEIAEIRKGYEKRVDELELKEKEFACKEKRVFFDVESVEKQLKCVHEKELEIDEIRKGYEKRVDELELKEKEFASNEKRLFSDAKLVEERLAVIEAKEKELELIRKEERFVVEAKEKVLESIRKVPELYGEQDLNKGSAIQVVPEEKLHACQAKVEIDLKKDIPNVDSLWLTLDVKNLLLFLIGGVKEHDLLRDEVYNALRLSSDPAKFVLDVMEGFNPCKMKKGDVESDTRLIWKIYILLLEQLMRISVQIGPHVKAAALTLALNWKNKMRAVGDGLLEVLAFLLLVCSYELASAFAARKLLNLVLTVSQHEAVVELFRRLGLVQMLSGWGLARLHIAMSEFIDRLVKKKQWLIAVKFIYEFGVVDKYPVVNFFREHVRRGKRLAQQSIKSGNKKPEAQIMAIDKRISSLKEVLECVMDYKINCLTRFSCGSLNRQIKRLEKLKEDEKLKSDKKREADGKFLTTAPVSQEPSETEILWKKEKAITVAAPDVNSKSVLSIPATTIDSAAAEETIPPVATTSSNKKHCREDASPTMAQAEQQRREKCPRIDSLADGQPIAAVHSMQIPSQQQAGFRVNQGSLQGHMSTGQYGLENPWADSLAGGQPIAAVHSMQPPSQQKAGLYVNEGNLQGHSSTGQYVCAVLMDQSVEEMVDQVSCAKAQGADMVEIRLDFIDNFRSQEHLQIILKNKPLPVIIAYRSKEDGRPYDGEEDARVEALLLAKEFRADYIEFEVKLQFQQASQLMTRQKQNQHDCCKK